ncbi:1-acyl-sn-glycerol-3-phosphate acyltransferase [bacterium]|nr:1-acyl-sn-glycerol-3-phosphate acyltransferase [bacterium]
MRAETDDFLTAPNRDSELYGPTGSHPSIRFEHLPVVQGPLSTLDTSRSKLLKDVTDKTAADLLGNSKASMDMLLSEALYQEKARLRRERVNIFTRQRKKNDYRLWNQIQSGLLKSPSVVDRRMLFDNVLHHYAEEIGGHFNPKTYEFATRTVPFGFSWLLNAASVRRFLPWKLTQSLESRLKIVGEIPMIRKLAQEGTILLVPTHQSNIDSVLIGYVIYLMGLPPFSYGAGLNLFSNPVLSYFMGGLGAYTVDRKKSNPIYKHLLKNYSTRILQEGIHSIFFPGGGRSRSGAIETKLKLGLLGTGLEAEIENIRTNKPKPRVFVVPMVVSYHFVLEASSLIEDYLSEAGKHRFIITDDESWQPTKILSFFWKLFSAQSGITCRIGKPMDIFGNFVDENGRSIGPNGTTIDPVRWLTSRGEVVANQQRDREYVRELGVRLADRFHKENTVISSHLVAFSFFETLRRQYPDLDLFRLLRISLQQRTLPLDTVLAAAEHFYKKVRALADRGDLYLDPELKSADTLKWFQDGLNSLGLFHDDGVVRMGDGTVWTEDMYLLYYYRNRLAGYGLSEMSHLYDKKGFLD